MKKTSIQLYSLLILAAGAFALAGCSSASKTIDSGKIRASTFSFVNTGGKSSPGYSDNRQAIHEMIQGAITKNLTERGITKVATGGDITLAYLVIVGNNVATKSINDYFGYSDDADALAEKAHSSYTNTKNPNYFEAGTLVIDIIDAKTFKRVKRGYATRPILRNLPADARAARIQEVVDEILRDLQIAH